MAKKNNPTKRPNGGSKKKHVLAPPPKGNKRALNNKGGAPTKFKARYISDMIKFFTVEAIRKEIMETNDEFFKDGTQKKKSVKYKHMPNKLPTIFGFARKIGVDYSTVYRWAHKGDDENLTPIPDKNYTEKELKDLKTHQDLIREFCKSFREAKELQKEFLITVGLGGAAPSPFTIFTAKNLTDMKDKQDVDVTSGGQKIKGINYIVPTDESNSEADMETTPGISGD